MAESFRPYKLSSHLVSCLFVLLVLANDAVASPIHTTNLARAHTDYVQSTHWRRVAPIVKTSEIGNTTAVINPSTNQVIPQGSGTDGGGTDFSLTAIIWLAFVLVTGLPLALAGIRLHRVTTGLAVGLGLTLCGESFVPGRTSLGSIMEFLPPCTEVRLRHLAISITLVATLRMNPSRSR